MKIKAIITMCCMFILNILSGCNEVKDSNEITFGTSAEYPPFEYNIHGELVGYDIELGHMIADKLGKKAKFIDMQYSTIMPAINSENVDAGLATITITEERKKNFSFSEPYYVESLAVLFNKNENINKNNNFSGKKIACQIGTTMEAWLKGHANNSEIISMDNNSIAVEALKAKHVDGVLIDSAQAKKFAKKNSNLNYELIAKADSGYGVAFKKNSNLIYQVNNAIKSLKAEGKLDYLEKKYLKSDL